MCRYNWVFHFPHPAPGSFTALNVVTPSIATSLGEDIVLECNISYPTAQDLMDANATLIWSTELSNVASSQSVTVMDRYLVSELSLPSVNSSYCGMYTCTASDDLVALSTSDTAMVQVGKYSLKFMIIVIHSYPHCFLSSYYLC